MKTPSFSRARVGALAAITLCGGCASLGPSDAPATTALVSACTQTANSYPYSRDRLDYEAYGDLFAPDAVFDLTTIGAGELVGREAIVSALKARGPAAVTRHINQVVTMEAVDAAHARGLSYVVVYAVPADAMAAGNSAVSQPLVVAEYHDQFVWLSGRCQIERRRLEVIFDGRAQ